LLSLKQIAKITKQKTNKQKKKKKEKRKSPAENPFPAFQFFHLHDGGGLLYLLFDCLDFFLKLNLFVVQLVDIIQLRRLAERILGQFFFKGFDFLLQFWIL